MRARRRAIAVVLACVWLTSCRLAVDVDVVVDRDAGGRLAVGLAADEELLRRARAAGADPLGDLAAAGRALRSSGWVVARRTDGAGGHQVRLSTEFDDPEQFNLIAAQLQEALAAPEVSLLEGLRLDVDGARVGLTGRAGLVPRPAAAGPGVPVQRLTRRLGRAGALEYRITARLPGRLVRTNATRSDDGGLRWQLRPGEQLQLQATTRRAVPAQAPVPPGAAAAAAATAVVLAAAGVVLWRRRGRPG